MAGNGGRWAGSASLENLPPHRFPSAKQAAGHTFQPNHHLKLKAMILTGIFRIGRDAEIRYTPSGDAVINLSLAYNYGKKDEGGKRPTQWVDAGLWGKRAESLAAYLLTGTAIWCTVEDLHIESFQKADGTPGVKLAGRVGQLEFAGKPQERDGAAQQNTTAPRRPPPAAAPPPRQAPARAAAAATGFDDMDDDIPF